MPALKCGTVFSSTATTLPVRGLRPMRALRLPHHEDAEPTQLDALAASQSRGDLVEDRRDDQFSILLPQMRIAGGEFRDEFCPGHRYFVVTSQVGGVVRPSGRRAIRCAGSVVECLEQIPALLSGGRDQRSDNGEVRGALLGAEATDILLRRNFIIRLLALGEIVGERHAQVGYQEAEHVRFARAEPQQQIVADPVWRWAAWPAFSIQVGAV